MFLPLQVLDEENETASKAAGDQKEKEKMLFNVIFTTENGSFDEDSNRPKIRTLKKTEKKPKHIKVNIMKKIAYFLNPLVYIIFNGLYFVYFLRFF